MLLKEIVDEDYAVRKLMVQMDFVTDGNELEALTLKLLGLDIEPTPSNIKQHLVKCLAIPINELPMPERAIILRSGEPERFA
ncbi:MAG: hypothetical protein ACXWTT_00910 [Methylobacter sp.]